MFVSEICCHTHINDFFYFTFFINFMIYSINYYFSFNGKKLFNFTKKLSACLLETLKLFLSDRNEFNI